MRAPGRAWPFPLAVLCGLALWGPASSADLQAQASERGFLELGGDRIFYEVAGRGEAVVLLHDGLTHGGIWDDPFRRLAGSFRVVRYDRRGHGRSDVPTGPHSPVGDLEALLDRLRVERGRRNMAPLSDGNVEAALSNWVEDRYLISADDVDARKRLRALMEPYAEKRFLAYDPGLVKGPDAPVLPRLAALDVPALVVVGAEDIPDVHAHAGAIDSRLPDSRRIVVPEAGHLVPFERPRTFLRLVLDFLRSRRGSVRDGPGAP